MIHAIFSIHSSGFTEGAELPARLATTEVVGGQNLSPAIEWNGTPANTQSFVILMQDPHPVAHHWIHWAVVDIPKETTKITEGASRQSMPVGSRELITSWGRTGYDGAQPPAGSGKHPYEITVYAMNVPHFEFSGEVVYADFLKAIEDKVIASGKITGYFEQ